MSNEAQAWARKLTVGGCGRKAVLMALANRADEAWSCFPGQELIARETEQTSRTVRTHLEALEAAGLIRREQRRRGDGMRTSDRYFLLPEDSSGEVVEVTGNERQGHRKLLQTSPETVSGQETSEEPSVEDQTLELVVEAPKQVDPFDEWYAAYPRKAAVGDARKAYKAALKRGATPEQLLTAVKAFPFPPKPARGSDDYRPYPASWLNRERYLDDCGADTAQTPEQAAKARRRAQGGVTW